MTPGFFSVFDEEALDEMEIQDFWIIRNHPVSTPPKRDAEQVSMKVWIPVRTEATERPKDRAEQKPSETREEWLRRLSDSLRRDLDLDPLPEDHDFSPEARDRRLMALIRPTHKNEDPEDGNER